MMEQKLSEIVIAIFNDLQCGHLETEEIDERERFGEASIVLCGGYLELLPEIPL